MVCHVWRIKANQNERINWGKQKEDIHTRIYIVYTEAIKIAFDLWIAGLLLLYIQNVNLNSIHFYIFLWSGCAFPDVPSLLILIKCRYLVECIVSVCACACGVHHCLIRPLIFQKWTTLQYYKHKYQGCVRMQNVLIVSRRVKRRKKNRKIIHSPEWWQWWFSFRAKSCSHSFCC